MTKWPVHKQTKRTKPKHVEHHDATAIQIFFSFLFCGHSRHRLNFSKYYYSVCKTVHLILLMFLISKIKGITINVKTIYDLSFPTIIKYLIKWYRNYIKFNFFRMLFQSKTVARRNTRIYIVKQLRVNQSHSKTVYSIFWL